MIALPLIGLVIGALVFGLIVVIRPPKLDPLVMLARYDAARAAYTGTGAPESPARAAGGRGMSLVQVPLRVGEKISGELTRRGINYTSLRQDLALCGRSFEAAVGRKVLAAVAGFLFGLVIAVGLASMSSLGITLPPGAPIISGLVLAAVFFFIPDIEARREAARRRDEFQDALSAYLDWVSLLMSGAAAPETAVPAAAEIGGNWALAVIRHTVRQARNSRQDVWTAFAELGRRIGITQLTELGSLVQLVAHDGAQVRSTLTARAASLRSEKLAKAEGTAGKRDQSMLVAQILLGVGFSVFIGYPAIVNFMSV